ncbi:PIG-L family deacetylase [Paraburkholderia sp. MMS20-SJTR3]|uniref:PIG-L family deacetylase n=1 Tax=Paraburkholderia sejongensis TaxID=2886946 RepID=A0ABS8K000_9BURK|nr:PIG-L family deacetylase [Paraburkholderia sp. MMS20-SJTR3]MCC8395480.1 PIG-L family deacetylase [Paraburkholderia sp. MMS20-SJTR3]
MTSKNPRLLVVSPHLDDAVLSCGLLLAAHPGTTVCTVFSAPPAHNLTTDWDRQSGFADAFEAMHARKAEDREALALLGARALHLPFCDAQYDATPALATLTVALEQIVAAIEPTHLLMPLGLFHSDHLLVADACLNLLERPLAISLLAYEDVPYRHLPGTVQQRLCELARRGFLADAPDTDDLFGAQQEVQVKRAAVDAYRSQMRAFGPDGRENLYSEERYWKLRVAAKADCLRARGITLAAPSLSVR